MIDRIIAWAVPFVLGGAVSLLTACFVFFRAIRDGVQCLLRAEIIRNHEKYMARKVQAGVCSPAGGAGTKSSKLHLALCRNFPMPWLRPNSSVPTIR